MADSPPQGDARVSSAITAMKNGGGDGPDIQPSPDIKSLTLLDLK
jgi:hypothetical protein